MRARTLSTGHGRRVAGQICPSRSVDAACRICDCTESAACTGGCWWVDDPEALGRLCSACLPLVLVAPPMPSAAAET